MSENINIIDDLTAEGRRMAQNETEADILAEMQESGEVARFYADRLDAARKREMEAVGNAAKLREALCEILSYIETFHKYIVPRKREKTTALFAVADTIREKARAALAEPPRNCDSGTADEQLERFIKKYESVGYGKIDERSIHMMSIFSRWAQMPYGSEAAK